MNIDQALSQARPIIHLIGTALIAAGLAKFFGVHISILKGSGLEIAVAGYLTKEHLKWNKLLNLDVVVRVGRSLQRRT